jgi:two-component system NtrC family sensor kinase
VTYLTIGFAYIVVYAVIGGVLRSHASAQAVFATTFLLIPALATCAAILWRRRNWIGCHRLFWDAFGIGLACWTIGHLGWAYETYVHKHQAWVQWHTLFSLCGGIGPLIALFARPHRGARTYAVAKVSFLLAGYGLAAVFVYSYFVLIPPLVPGGGNADVTLLQLVQVNRALLFVLMTAMMILGRRTSWLPTYRWLAIGTGAGFMLRIFTSMAIARGAYQSGTMYDLAWIVPFLCYLNAVLTAPDSPAENEGEAPVAPLHSAIALIPVFLVPIVGYGTIFLYPLGGSGDSLRAMLTGFVTVAGLGLLTLRLATQSGELQRADARMRLLAAATEQTADLILITRVDGAIEHANDAFVRALGFSRAELQAMRSPDLMERGFAQVGAHIATAVRDQAIWRGTVMRRRRDGSIFPASCTVAGIKDTSGAVTHYVGVERDITDEVRLRDQLVHSERLSAIGELVAGVAHEINNPLQTIIGSVELMIEERPSPAVLRDLETVRREGMRAGQIVRNLLSFVRRSAPDRAPSDLNEIVTTTVQLREFHLQQNNIAVTPLLHKSPLQVLANREEIQQIVLNLLLNAEQAIQLSGRGSRITIRTYTSARQHLLEVADDGPGVNADVRGRIFEPFFTTKEVGEGTGLGLSISHGIAAAHGGALELCEVEAGACFRLALPAHAETVPVPAPAAPAAREAAALRALIVDDEVPVRRMLVRLLERRGFEVVEADSGAAALAIAGGAQLSLVLCDVRMPGMTGVDVYRELSKKDPKLGRTFVFITGDRSALEIEEALRNVPVLEKPFTAADLQDVLARVGFDSAVA